MRFRLFLLALASLALTSCELYDRLTWMERANEERIYYERHRDSGIGQRRD